MYGEEVQIPDTLSEKREKVDLSDWQTLGCCQGRESGRETQTTAPATIANRLYQNCRKKEEKKKSKDSEQGKKRKT